MPGRAIMRLVENATHFLRTLAMLLGEKYSDLAAIKLRTVHFNLHVAANACICKFNKGESSRAVRVVILGNVHIENVIVVAREGATKLVL